MKTMFPIVLVIILLQLLSAETLEEGLRRQLAETKGNPSQEKIIKLVQEITANYRYEEQLNPSLLSATNEVRDELCRIPGHARYLTERVAILRKSSKDIVFDLRYHDACEMLLNTLPHLPSPETVLVVGALLESEADIPTPAQKMEMLRSKDKGANVAWFYPSGMAGQILLALEIRQTPEGSGRNGVFTTHDIEPLRAWWQEVKSGSKKLSFKGQAVEYRFKPDGTWDTFPMANPPDDGPKPAAAVLPSLSEVRPGPNESTSEQTMTRPWPWILIAMLGGLATVVWFGLRKST